MIVMTDGVEREIVSFVGEQKPEKGGALFGPRHSNLISQFIPDPEAKTTSASYTPSDALRAAAGTVERERGLVFKGIVHSHPRDYDQLSGGDLQTLARYFEANPSLQSFYCPIINRSGKPVAKAPNVLDLGNGISLTGYEAWRWDKPNGFGYGNQKRALVNVRKVRTTVMPVDAAAQEVAAGLDTLWGFSEIETGHIKLSGQHYEVRIMAGGGSELQLLFPAGFPAVKPAALLTRNPGTETQITEELLFPWRLFGSGVGELAKAILPLIDGSPPAEPQSQSPNQTRTQRQTSGRSEAYDTEAGLEQVA